MKKILLLLFLLTAQAKAGYLKDNVGGYLLDTKGGRILISDNVHTLTFLSNWGSGQTVSVWFDVLADKSGIHIWGTGLDAHSPVTQTEVVHVLPDGTHVSLLKCPQPICDVIWPTSQMTAGQANEILFYMTSSAGLYGASTRISKPQ